MFFLRIGFPSPPPVSCPKGDVRFAKRGARTWPGTGGQTAGDNLDFLFFLSFLIVLYRSDARSRKFAPTCKYGTEAGFWLALSYRQLATISDKNCRYFRNNARFGGQRSARPTRLPVWSAMANVNGQVVVH
jgi:hypothetical protein